MTPSSIFLTLTVAFLCTLFLRALPFLIFNDKRTMPDFLKKLSNVLPPTIIAVLVVYCLKDLFVTSFDSESIALIVASLVVALTYKLKHNTLISIAAGTAVNMLLLAFL